MLKRSIAWSSGLREDEGAREAPSHLVAENGGCREGGSEVETGG